MRKIKITRCIYKFQIICKNTFNTTIFNNNTRKHVCFSSWVPNSHKFYSLFEVLYLFISKEKSWESALSLLNFSQQSHTAQPQKLKKTDLASKWKTSSWEIVFALYLLFSCVELLCHFTIILLNLKLLL